MKKILLGAALYVAALIITVTAAFGIMYAVYSPVSEITDLLLGSFFSKPAELTPTVGIEESLMAKKEEAIKALDEKNAHLKELGYDSVVDITDMKFPVYGELYGTVKIERLGIDCDLYMGDSQKILKRGAGTFYGASIPGDNGTVMIVAHCTTFFRPLEKTKVGDIIEISTSYGDYVYEVVETKVAPATRTDTYDLTADHENLILYTCYPLNTLKARTDRFFVYGKLLSGVMIDRG